MNKNTATGTAVLLFGLATISAAAEGPLPPSVVNKLHQMSASQNEGAIPKPVPVDKRSADAFNENRNLYFGDTHVHTALSFDAYLAGNRFGLDEAYRFAMGEPLELITGEVAQLSQPLDFVVMTDHAESYGLFVTCVRDDLTERQKAFCAAFDAPSGAFFQKLRKEGTARPPVRSADLCEDQPGRCVEDAKTTWREVRAAAEKYYQPGRLTTFSGYEYSPVLPKQGKIHRNVIFRGKETPDRVVSAYEALSVLDLWESLESECSGDCNFLTIPHNMNKTWGLAYAGRTIDGELYSSEDWALRGRSEPLAEIYQIKGNSECGYGLGANDEECNFELAIQLCAEGDVPGCSGPNSFAREGLKKGLALEQELGFNPLQFGFVGSTDNHNSTPGDTEEYDYRGSSQLHESPASARLGMGGVLEGKFPGKILRRKSPGGLAAVWARQNNREEIFDAMERRETYATSGTRIKLRFFAGSGFAAGILNSPEMLSKAYDGGVPMGGELPAGKLAPEFIAWAVQDPGAAPLQRMQMIKAWTENGETREQVTDIACADGLVPDAKTGRCPDNGAAVSLSTCAISSDKGDAEIKVRWSDPDFNPALSAVYYVRVLENPSCRWSTYDAIRIGAEPAEDVPATIQERAWSSPIWYKPGGEI
jgi:Protein of unknown function (DUF3604)